MFDGSALSSAAKGRLDALFFLHAVLFGLEGAFAFLLPHWYQHMIIATPVDEGVHPGGIGKVAHLIMRMYGGWRFVLKRQPDLVDHFQTCTGAMLLVQAWLVWNLRRVGDATIRRAVVQGVCAGAGMC